MQRKEHQFKQYMCMSVQTSIDKLQVDKTAHARRREERGSVAMCMPTLPKLMPLVQEGDPGHEWEGSRACTRRLLREPFLLNRVATAAADYLVFQRMLVN